MSHIVGRRVDVDFHNAKRGIRKPTGEPVGLHENFRMCVLWHRNNLTRSMSIGKEGVRLFIPERIHRIAASIVGRQLIWNHLPFEARVGTPKVNQVVAPIPSAIASSATSVNAGDFSSVLAPKRRSALNI